MQTQAFLSEFHPLLSGPLSSLYRSLVPTIQPILTRNWLNNLKEEFYTNWGHPGGGNRGEADSSAWYRNHDGVGRALRTGSASNLLLLHTPPRELPLFHLLPLRSQEEALSTHLGKVFGNDRAMPTILECDHLAAYPGDDSLPCTDHRWDSNMLCTLILWSVSPSRMSAPRGQKAESVYQGMFKPGAQLASWACFTR